MKTVLVSFILNMWAVGGAPPPCCTSKVVGGVEYTLNREEDTTQYDCVDNCIFEKIGEPGRLFCFAVGDLEVVCGDAPPSGGEGSGMEGGDGGGQGEGSGQEGGDGAGQGSSEGGGQEGGDGQGSGEGSGQEGGQTEGPEGGNGGNEGGNEGETGRWRWSWPGQ